MEIKNSNYTVSEIFRTFLNKHRNAQSSEEHENSIEYFKEALTTIGDVNKLWFRLYANDPTVTTYHSIVQDITLPSNHINYQYLIDCLELAIKEPTGIQVHLDKY